MFRRALLSGLAGALAVAFSAAGQTFDQRGQINDGRLAFGQSSGSGDRSLLLHKGPVLIWSDGARLASMNSWVQIDFSPLDFVPAALLGSTVPSQQRTGRVMRPQRNNVASDGKDSTGEVAAPREEPIYYGGEIGVLYGQWSGRGGGDMWQTYVQGTVGTDKLQITAGAAYEEWNGRPLKFRAFNGWK